MHLRHKATLPRLLRALCLPLLVLVISSGFAQESLPGPEPRPGSEPGEPQAPMPGPDSLDNQGSGRINLPDIGDPASRTLSVAQEKRLGEGLIREVRQRIPISDDPQIRDYIQDLGNRLLSHTESPDFDFEFFVVESTAINAFAMPGGYIGVNSGLIMRAENESELAAVVAHEIAHVTQRHIARSLDASRGSGIRTLGIIMAAILLGMQDPEAGSAAVTAGMASSIQEQINYTRSHEREADNIGIRILAGAGLDPEGMPRFFERLDQATRHMQRPPEFLSTHPVTQNRIAESRSRAQAYGRGSIRESEMFGFMRARLLVARAESPKSAERHFRPLVDNGNDPAARYGLALALIQQRQGKEARGLLEGLLDSEGDHIPFYIALGQAQREMEDKEDGLDVFQLGLTLFPDNYPLTVELVSALIQDGKPEEARALVRRHLQRQGPDLHLHRLHAQAAAAAERPHEGKLAMAEYYQMSGKLRLAMDQLTQVADAPGADISDRSRAVARRQELALLFEARER